MTVEQFWRLVEKTDGCWVWLGSKDVKGYGRCYGGEAFDWNNNAHRVSWFLTNGSIPRGMIVCHRCDVPWCVRPDHLFLGTTKDNMLDMHKKGRAGWKVAQAKRRAGQIGTTRQVLEKQMEARRQARAAARKSPGKPR